MLRKATRQSTKEYNRRLVLKTIFEKEEISRADVARQTGLTKATVSDLVNELIEKRLIAESRYADTSVGKPPVLLEIERDGHHLICVDLANEEFRGAVINLRGEIIHTVVLPRDGHAGTEAIELLYALLDTLLEKTEQPILGIGIGTPGLIDTDNGIVIQAVNLEWQEVRLGEMLSERYSYPVYLANDSHIAALAEFIFGDCQPGSNLIAIKFGLGIGAGIVLNGELYQGESYGAGEIGHVRIVEGGELCRCGNSGCLETVASSRGVVQRALALAPTRPGTVLHPIFKQQGKISFKDVELAFQQGDSLAREIVLEAGRHLGYTVANLVAILNIHNIVLTGDMTVFGQPWLDAIHECVSQNVLASLAQKTNLRTGCLERNEVLLGASALMLVRELGLNLGPQIYLSPKGMIV